MMDFKSLYTLHHEQVEDELHKERRGIHLGSFYALMNIVKNSSRYNQRWLLNRSGLIILPSCVPLTNTKSPYSFLEWDEVEGREHLRATLQEGGALLTWHYGFVRHNMITIGQEIRAGHMSAKLPFYLIAERETVEQEKKLSGWDAIRKYAGAELLNAEDEMIGIRLYSHLRKGGSFSLLWMDRPDTIRIIMRQTFLFSVHGFVPEVESSVFWPRRKAGMPLFYDVNRRLSLQNCVPSTCHSG